MLTRSDVKLGNLESSDERFAMKWLPAVKPTGLDDQAPNTGELRRGFRRVFDGLVAVVHVVFVFVVGIEKGLVKRHRDVLGAGAVPEEPEAVVPVHAVPAVHVETDAAEPPHACQVSAYFHAEPAA